ncbi:MAG: hypothetical protein MJ252_28585 [archaeon]|nr:hypothetical protein [archaeon]
MIISYYKRQNPQLAVKYSDLFLKILIGVDVIFLIVMFFVWVKSKGSSPFWESLHTFHMITYFLAIAEIILKVIGIMRLKGQSAPKPIEAGY